MCVCHDCAWRPACGVRHTHPLAVREGVPPRRPPYRLSSERAGDARLRARTQCAMRRGAKRGRAARAGGGAPGAALLSLADHLCGDTHCVIFSKLASDPLAPSDAIAYGSASHALRAATRVARAQLRADSKPARVLARAAGQASLKALREARVVAFDCSHLRADQLEWLGTLAPSLPALEALTLYKPSPEMVIRFVGALGVAEMSRVAELRVEEVEYDDDDDDARGDVVASALGTALARAAFPNLKRIRLARSGIGDAGLVALAPALRRRPALCEIDLDDNPLGDAGVAALVGPGTGSLDALRTLSIRHTEITDVGCAALEAALDSGALSRLEFLCTNRLTRASPAALERIFVWLGYRSKAEMDHEDAINALGDDEDDESGYEPTVEDLEFYTANSWDAQMLDADSSDDDEF